MLFLPEESTVLGTQDIGGQTLSVETHWREYADLQLAFDKLKMALTSGRFWAIPTTLNRSC